ncbi:hypothetical protein K438DRAFT_1748620 [Mycena galopus ATCC 62051]|nr:hypothetical protein K438DRAFT_1748620 [Mycena galopus ATCC 62051]
MDFFFMPANGSLPVPLWTTQGKVLWCSVGGLPIDIPEDVNIYVLQPNHEGFKKVLLVEGAEEYTAYFHPSMHWLGWSLNAPLDLAPEGTSPWRDPAEFAFRHKEVDLLESWIDIVELGSSESKFRDARGALVGYHVPEYWCSNACHLSERLRNVSEVMAADTEWYGRNSQYRALAILPVAIDDGVIHSLQSSVEEAERRIRGARLIIRSQLGWLSWFTAANREWGRGLDSKDKEFVKSLRLPLRKKRGFLFNLSRDYHKTNFRFLLANEVPFHYAWTDAEEKTGHFLRCSPRYLSEYEDLASRSQVDLTGLPSYASWREDLERYDHYFQDAFSGRVGFVVMGYQPYWDYKIIDYAYYGARPVDSRAERNTTIEELRMPSQHQYRLSDFGTKVGSIERDEHVFFYEDPSIVRERWRNRCAPRPNRAFNTFSRREANDSTAIPSTPSGAKSSTSGPGQGSSLARAIKSRTDIGRTFIPMSLTRQSSESGDVLKGVPHNPSAPRTRRDGGTDEEGMDDPLQDVGMNLAEGTGRTELIL